MTDTLVRTQAVEAHGRASVRTIGIVGLFTATAFVGAGLLFVVQPMVARLVLPSFGGSATVWSTSSLFFQVLLLLGYLYTHAATRRFGPRWQPSLHLLVLLVPLVVLPIALPTNAAPPADASPVLWLLRVLAGMIGLPFLVLSTTGPLLQRWYAWSGGPRADDPYFLFAASNLGSFGGLLAYPFIVEPVLTLEQQRAWWAWGFVVFVAMTCACGLLTRNGSQRRQLEAPSTPPIPERGAIGRLRVARWTLWAFLPSAMMLAVTSHVSTDIAPIPLLWVVPLAIYLGTFVIAFGRSSRAVPAIAVRLAVAATFLAAAASLMVARTPILLDVVLDMVMLGCVAFVAHARLAADRPGVGHLTVFYLVVAGGGALGGLLNGVLAPAIFDRVLEYPLVTVLAPLAIVPALTAGHRAKAAFSAGLRTRLAVGVAAVIAAVPLGVALSRWADHIALAYVGLVLAMVAGWLLSTRRVLVAIILALIFTGSAVKFEGGSLDHRRTFFGSYRVFESGGLHQFAHGTTVHGTQWMDGRRNEPTTYYSRGGPLGDVFALSGTRDVGVVGLGVGTIAAYGTSGQQLRFIEIDPEVVAIARDPDLFTYLRDSRATISTTVGDGRLEIAKLPKASLDVLVLDAFSSDAIPVHLLTAEAMRTYADRLRPGGLLVVHISNNVFDLAPVLSGAAQAMGWSGRVAFGGGVDPGAAPSRWVVLAATPSPLEPLTRQSGWGALPSDSVTWTDDYSSILSVLK